MSDLRKDPTPESIQFEEGEQIPNNPTLPTLIYQQIFDSEDPGNFVFETFRQNSWGECWENGVFSYHHFHSSAHEALAVTGGRARVCLGGPQGQTFDITRGDLIVMPAGVGHCRKQASNDFSVAGAYPPGQDWDLLRKLGSNKSAIIRSIKNVPLPDNDPFYGPGGPLVEIWNDSVEGDDRVG